VPEQRVDANTILKQRGNTENVCMEGKGTDSARRHVAMKDVSDYEGK
jgi:hypothetical protein